MAMRVETCTSIYFGVNWLFAPSPNLDGPHLRRFQNVLGEKGVEFTHTDASNQGMGVFARVQNSPIEVRVAAQSGAPVGQFTIIAANPGRTLEDFQEEAEVLCAAFAAVWDGSFQVVARDCTIRHLYSVDNPHAFQYLWVTRFGQDESDLGMLGRPVLGGGLRLVMPPTEGEDDPKQVEVKIESFLPDSRKLYVDVQMAWPKPAAPNAPMAPRALLAAVHEYATTEVVNFIKGHTA